MDKYNLKSLYNANIGYESHISDLEKSISTEIEKICGILEKKGFIEKNSEITTLGKIAVHIREVHPLVFADVLNLYNFFDELSTKEIVAILSIFTNVNVIEEERRMIPLQNRILMNINLYVLEYEKFEQENGLNTGIEYSDILQYDIYYEIKEWFDCENEEQCKYFIQTKLNERGISIGDFTKAVLKIVCISKELITICELLGRMDLLFKLKQIESAILKYVIISQSLYI